MPGAFERNVTACAALKEHYRRGLQAIRPADTRRIVVRQTRAVTGSINLDSALGEGLPNAPRWDYGIGLRSRRDGAEIVHWIEVHPAADGEARAVEAKLDWLVAWLRDNAPQLSAMPRRYVWVSSGETRLTPTAPALRRLAQKGLIAVGHRYAIG